MGVWEGDFSGETKIEILLKLVLIHKVSHQVLLSPERNFWNNGLNRQNSEYLRKFC